MPSTKVQLSGGAFQDALGNVVANGYMLMQLSQDSQVTGASPEVQVVAGNVIKILLDSNGNVQASPAQYIWPNDVLTPQNTYYTVSVYNTNGQLVWGPNSQQVLSSPSPFDIGTWSPAVVNISSTAVVTYDIAMFFPQQVTANQVIMLLPIERRVTFAANLYPSKAACGINPAAPVAITFKKNGTTFATLNIDVTGIAAFSSAGTSFAAGDVLTVVGPTSYDAVMANVGILLSGVTTGNT